MTKIAILFAVAILLAACGRQAENTALPVPPPEPYVWEILLEETAAREISGDLFRGVRFTEENFAAVREAIEGIEVFFYFDELFYLDESLARYMSFPPADIGREFVMLSQMPFTAEGLFAHVRANNDAFFDAAGFTNYAALDDEFLLWACGVMADTLNRELTNYCFHPAILHDLDYLLQNLRIKENPFSPARMAGVTWDEGYMTLNPTVMATTPRLFGCPAAEYKTIAHEVQHLIQRRGNATLDALGVYTMWGFNFRDESLSVQSLFWEWFIEASAERLSADQFDGIATTYRQMVGYLDTLALTILAGEDMYVRSVARLSQQPYLQAAFDLFNRRTPEEQMDFLKMMYSIEIMQFLPEDFIALHEERVGEVDDFALRIPLRNGILTVASQIFYETLAELLTREEIPLADIFLLIAIYESGLAGHGSYTDIEWFVHYPRFAAAYVKLQDAFFSQLGALEEIASDFDTFNAQIETPWVRPYRVSLDDPRMMDIEFSWLCAQRNEFLRRYFFRTGENKTITFRQAAEMHGGTP